MPGAIDNDDLVLRVVEDVIRGGNPPTVTSIIERTVPKGRNNFDTRVSAITCASR